jgi:hypothetical protein
MPSPNAWAAVAVMAGGLCVTGAFLKYWNTPPPVPPPNITAVPNATGDTNASDTRAWNDLADLIDTEHCNRGRLEALTPLTGWNLWLDLGMNPAQVGARRSAIAEYRTLRSDILADEQNRTNQGKVIIGHLQEGARAKAMRDFLEAEQGLMANEADQQHLQENQLDTILKMTDVAEAANRKGKPSREDGARWDSLAAVLNQWNTSHSGDWSAMEAEAQSRYRQLDRLVGRRPLYSYSRPAFKPWECKGASAPEFQIADIDKEAQKILAE